MVDAIGLSTFAFIGAEKADEAGLGVFAIIFLATLTAVGGGLLRDIAIREVPQITFIAIFMLHQPYFWGPLLQY